MVEEEEEEEAVVAVVSLVLGRWEVDLDAVAGAPCSLLDEEEEEEEEPGSELSCRRWLSLSLWDWVCLSCRLGD